MSVASLCSTCFCVILCFWCTGHFVTVPLNLTCLHCLQHSFFEHIFNSILLHCKSTYFIRKSPYQQFFYAVVTNKTDIVWFQRFEHYRRIWQSLGHRTIFFLSGHISYGHRSASVYDNIGRCPAGHRMTSYGARPALQDISRTPYGARSILH